jgi:hypothetical protein
MQIRLRQSARNKRFSVQLDDAAKIKIRHYIDQIKTVIDEADLPVEKHDKLHNKRGDFADEVEKIRTGFQTAMAVTAAVFSTIGEGFEKLEPARKWLDSVAALLGKAKEAEEAFPPRLPPVSERKRLEAPRRELPPPRAVNDLDDDIPF